MSLRGEPRGSAVRRYQGMRIEPHENLMVWSIRHDQFGPGRFHAILPDHSRTEHIHSPAQAISIKVVQETMAPGPADCPPCDRGDFPGFSSDPPASNGVTSQGGDTHGPGVSAPAADLSFSHGQAVPGTGSLLDIMA